MGLAGFCGCFGASSNDAPVRLHASSSESLLDVRRLDVDEDSAPMPPGDTSLRVLCARQSSSTGTEREVKSVGAQVPSSQETSSFTTLHSGLGSHLRSQLLHSALGSVRSQGYSGQNAITDERNSACRTSRPSCASVRASARSLPSQPLSAVMENDLPKVVALVKELSMSSSGHSIAKHMALLVAQLPASFACMTSFSTSGNHYQHCGAACMYDQQKLCTAPPAFLTCLDVEGSKRPIMGSNGSCNWPNSPSGSFSMSMTPVELASGLVSESAHVPSLLKLLSQPGSSPLSFVVLDDASNIDAMPTDWQALIRRHALRSIICIPIRSVSSAASSQGTLLGW